MESLKDELYIVLYIWDLRFTVLSKYVREKITKGSDESDEKSYQCVSVLR
jgi:hypothetical protein